MAFLWWKIRTKMRGNQKLHLSHMAIIYYHGEEKVLIKLGAVFQSRGRKPVGSHKYTNCLELLQSHLKLVAVFDHCSVASKVWFPCVFCKLIYHSCRRHKQPSQRKDGWKVRQAGSLQLLNTVASTALASRKWQEACPHSWQASRFSFC